MTKRKQPKLCEDTDCTGCHACYSKCPHNCIEMIKDEIGFLFPKINMETCNGCRLCEQSCPILNNSATKRLNDPLIYACFNKSIKVREESTSGGAFSALARLTLKNNGYVFGASLNEVMEVAHVCIDNEENLYKLRKSKYVQSSIGASYIETRKLLLKSKLVFFTGTPCQIAGLYSYLGEDFENLLTAEIICHGTPSPLLFSKFIQYIQKQKKDKIIGINFRDKKYGWDNGMVIAGFFEKKGKKYLRFKYTSYIKFFLNSINLRCSCYVCSFKKLPKKADFTLGDFWGIGDKKDYEFIKEKKNGISLLMVHSAKGERIMRNLGDLLILEKRTYEEAILKNRSFLLSQKKHEQYSEFREDLIGNDFSYLIQKYNPLTYRRIIYEVISIVFGEKGLNKLVKLAKR